MADFVSSLIDKAFSRADVLVPRQPSLFEPLPVGAWYPGVGIRAAPVLVEHVEGETPEDMPWRSERQRTSPTSARAGLDSLPLPIPDERPTPPQVPAVRSVDAQLTPRSAWPDPRPAADQERARFVAPSPPAFSQIERHFVEDRIETIRIVDSGKVQDGFTLSRLQSPTLEPLTPVQPPLGGAHAPEPAPSDVTRAAASTEAAESVVGSPIELAPRIAAEVISAHLPRPAQAKLQPRERPVAATRLPPVDHQPVRPEGPTIQVTIGRVEVRVSPSPRPLPARPSEMVPRLSLDEYLRQRQRAGG